MCHHLSRNYRIIRVMFWSFPSLLWQAFGNWSGFLVGVLVAVILTVMFNGLFRRDNWHTASSAGQQSLQTAEPQPRSLAEYRKQAEPSQRGYRAEEQPYRARPHLYQTGAIQPQHEEMLVPYPQEEMPSIKQEEMNVHASPRIL